MRRMRVLVVGDSVVVRRVLADALQGDADIEAVETAASVRIALAKIAQNPPDLVTLDIGMSEMGGIEMLTALRGTHPRLPAIMFSVHPKSSSLTLDVLAMEGVDYVTTPSSTTGMDDILKVIREVLLPRIKMRLTIVSRLKPGPPPPGSSRLMHPTLPRLNDERTGHRVDVVVMGASTGGPDALTEVLPCFPPNFPVPVLIVQHMPPVFTRLLAVRLAAVSQIRVAEATESQILEPGHAWVAPGGFHMRIEKIAGQPRIRIDQGIPENSCRPSVDVLFRSAARTYGSHVLAVMMTGMGQDGSDGCHQIRKALGRILIQDQASSVVWGMPRFAVQAGLGDVVLPLCELGPEIVRRITARHKERPNRGYLPGARAASSNGDQ